MPHALGGTMKRIVKRTTTTEEWVDPGDEENEPRDVAEDEDDTDQDDDQDEAEDHDDEAGDEPKPSRRRR